MNEPLRRFVIYGPPGSGKSTVASRIAESVGVPHVELDAIFWKPGWVESSLEEFRADVAAALERCPDGWACDGNYSKVRDLILPCADAVVWLRPPFRVAFWRLLRRTIARSRDRKLLWGTNRESLRQAFFSRESLLLYQAAHWRKYSNIGADLNETPHHARVVELRSRGDVEAFLDGLS